MEFSERQGLDSCYECSYSNELDPLSGICSVKEEYVGSDIYTCNGYRLPTEAEFEYLSRSGTTQAIWSPSGGGFYLDNTCSNDVTLTDTNSSLLSDVALYCGNSNDMTSMTSQFSENDLGLYDTIGNVAEWVHDNHSFFPADTTNPVGSDVGGMARGGSWYSYPSELSHGTRMPFLSTSTSNQVGFRLLRIVE